MRFAWWLTIFGVFVGSLSVFEGVYLPITILKNKDLAIIPEWCNTIKGDMASSRKTVKAVSMRDANSPKGDIASGGTSFIDFVNKNPPVPRDRSDDVTEQLNCTLYKCYVTLMNTSKCACYGNLTCTEYEYDIQIINTNISNIFSECTSVTTLNPKKKYYCYLDDTKTLLLFFPKYNYLTYTNKVMAYGLFPIVAISITWGVAKSTYRKSAPKCCTKNKTYNITEQQKQQIEMIKIIM